MNHQEKQKEVINQIEEEVRKNTISFSTVTPVEDFENDSRMCLTSVHLPHRDLITKIRQDIITPLKEVEPSYYFFPDESLHMTIKNIRVVNDPPPYTDGDCTKAEEVLSQIIPQHKKFQVYYYRLLLFQTNVALIGTTDPELDDLHLDLDQALKNASIPDDKTYLNSRYFFSNITLVRFSSPSERFKAKVEEISNTLSFEPYTVDSVSLVTCNAVLKKLSLLKTWHLT